MDEQRQTVEIRRRRSPQEIQELLVRFESSGLSRVEFCKAQGVSLASLARYRKRHAHNAPPTGTRLVAVEVMSLRSASEHAGLAVAVRGGRRIEVRRGFDARTLAQLVGVLERL
jgi:hypothetical protein